jgi:uncharacterized membrane protein
MKYRITPRRLPKHTTKRGKVALAIMLVTVLVILVFNWLFGL